ncbi:MULTISPECIES: deoxyribodipyrimidine photo-lyase [unclassified Streptomyces]|uniref:cryptochrome/photolyase family protein n=1 Tax=unclassified Streptomyces TaxID=2593676 RepID=UPI00081F20BA|nr:deoxyribodipyrimidine photo-lyase [Streptomyces sp. LcepLS]MYR27503.1 deoxyribodipyrimidine photo-lyase [Streptomyces sp. SID4945]SCF24745.1 deoxyribodipyrimidine photo-lyase [Streptomyces sp. LcepLS]
MKASIVLYTSDLRLHDHPPLRAAVREAEEVVPLFVRDPGIKKVGFHAANRAAFLADCLGDLDAGLRERGGRLVVRAGDPAQVVRELVGSTGAERVHVAAGVSAYARNRADRLRAALEGTGAELVEHEAVITALPPGEVVPGSKDHFAVFTPYHRQWSAQHLREPLGAPRKLSVPSKVRSDEVPRREDVEGISPGLARGGEREGRAKLASWRRDGISRYEDLHDDLAGDGTSRLSPYLHFGALSAAECVHRARAAGGAGADAFVRQLCWRDFHHQVLAARPAAAHEDYRPRGDHWRTGSDAEHEAAAWREGRTGYPVVDAAMRQLAHEGWMHNRGRLLAASFLTKTLYLDWRLGAAHFLDLLVDGDLVNNQMNWQWVAGTGTDTRPGRVLNPLTQARKYDPEGDYVRQWVPELRGIEGRAVHEPWKRPREEREGYLEPLVDLAEGRDRFRRAREQG